MLVPGVFPVLGEIDDPTRDSFVVAGFLRLCPSSAVAFHRAAIVEGQPYAPMSPIDDVIDAEWRRRQAVRRENTTPEFQVLVGHRDLTPLAQQPDIVPVLVVQFVTRVKLHEPLWGNAPHWIRADYAATGQLLAAVRHTADISSCRIERVGVRTGQ